MTLCFAVTFDWRRWFLLSLLCYFCFCCCSRSADIVNHQRCCFLEDSDRLLLSEGTQWEEKVVWWLHTWLHWVRSLKCGDDHHDLHHALRPQAFCALLDWWARLTAIYAWCDCSYLTVRKPQNLQLMNALLPIEDTFQRWRRCGCSIVCLHITFGDNPSRAFWFFERIAIVVVDDGHNRLPCHSILRWRLILLMLFLFW